MMNTEAATNPYAPPIETPGDDGCVQVKPGSFGLGLVAGLLFGFWAFVVSLLWSSMSSETKRGIRIGFGTKVALTVMFAMIGAIAGAGR